MTKHPTYCDPLSKKPAAEKDNLLSPTKKRLAQLEYEQSVSEDHTASETDHVPKEADKKDVHQKLSSRDSNTSAKKKKKVNKNDSGNSPKTVSSLNDSDNERLAGLETCDKKVTKVQTPRQKTISSKATKVKRKIKEEKEEISETSKSSTNQILEKVDVKQELPQEERLNLNSETNHTHHHNDEPQDKNEGPKGGGDQSGTQKTTGDSQGSVPNNTSTSQGSGAVRGSGRCRTTSQDSSSGDSNKGTPNKDRRTPEDYIKGVITPENKTRSLSTSPDTPKSLYSLPKETLSSSKPQRKRKLHNFAVLADRGASSDSDEDLCSLAKRINKRSPKRKVATFKKKSNVAKKKTGGVKKANKAKKAEAISPGHEERINIPSPVLSSPRGSHHSFSPHDSPCGPSPHDSPRGSSPHGSLRGSSPGQSIVSISSASDIVIKIDEEPSHRPIEAVIDVEKSEDQEAVIDVEKSEDQDSRDRLTTSALATPGDPAKPKKRIGRPVGAKDKKTRRKKKRSDFSFDSGEETKKTDKLKKAIKVKEPVKKIKKTGENMSATSVGPVIRLGGSRTDPTRVEVLNGHDLELDKKKKRGEAQFEKLDSSSLDMNNAVPWVCAFCGKGPNFWGLGDLFGPYYIGGDSPAKRRRNSLSPDQKRRRTLSESKQDTKRQRRISKSSNSANAEEAGKETWTHAACAVWSHGVYLMGSKVNGLQEALIIASQNSCSSCKSTGAMLGCVSRGCNLKYHYLCALDKDCLLDEENYSLVCPKHKEKKLKVTGDKHDNDT